MKILIIIAILLAIVLVLILLGGGTQGYFDRSLFPSHDKTLIVNSSMAK